MDTQAQLEAHERECNMFREMINGKLSQLEKRLWRLEAMLMISTASVMTLAAMMIGRL